MVGADIGNTGAAADKGRNAKQPLVKVKFFQISTPFKKISHPKKAADEKQIR